VTGSSSHRITIQEALVRDILRGGAILYGLLAAGASLLAVLLSALLAVAGSGAPLVMATTIAASVVAVGCGLGLPLAVAGWHSFKSRASPRLRLPPLWACVLVLVACLGLGTFVLHVRAVSALLLPPLHVIASTLPGLILLAAVLPSLQSGGAGLTRRNFVAMVAYGGLVATAVAIALEGVAAMAVMGLAVTATAMFPGGQAALEQLSRDLQSPAVLSDPERVLDVFVSPALVLGVGLLVAVVTPLIEETVKSLGALGQGSFLRRLSRSQAFAYGVIIGCGFGFVEALFYASAGLPTVWTSSVVVRAATTVIHATATGLAALGWCEAWHGRPLRSLGFLAAGIGLHVVWNGMAGLSAAASLGLFGHSAAGRTVEVGLAALANTSLVVLFIASIVSLGIVTRHVRYQRASLL
jgi:hypothetical protein